MKYPTFSNISKNREILTAFRGYNHSLTCSEGEFYHMQNMTSEYYPVLAPRNKRGICRTFENPMGMLDKEKLLWIDDGKLYVDGELQELDGVTISTEENMCPKSMAKMGAYVIIMPDKIWYNADDGTCGYMEASFEAGDEVSLTQCDNSGAVITWHDEAYYKENEPISGDYMMTTSGGKSVLKQYSATSAIWVTVNSTYIQITSTGIGKDFKKGDGIKITVDNSEVQWEGVKNIFVNEEEDGKLSVNTTITDITEDCITIAGILDENKQFTGGVFSLSVERKVPDMEFVIECNNRLWGCSKDGHEVYCCKLGDVTNWNCFQGISTDSWAATIGSDGRFTGAVTFQSYPTFFKENSMIKIAISATGGHQVKETHCRGVQKGSERSLCILNETLFYKGTQDVYMLYQGGMPQSVSDVFGDERYYEAVAGTLGDKYYISMRDTKGKYHLFVYDAKTGVWCREDDTEVLYFCNQGDELYFVDIYKALNSVKGAMIYGDETQRTEEKFEWLAESGPIGYESPDRKYVSRISIRLSMEPGSSVDFYIMYDSSEAWEHKFSISGTGTRTFTVPVIPKRCDHFAYRIKGKGNCKIYSIAKTIEEGSDI